MARILLVHTVQKAMGGKEHHVIPPLRPHTGIYVLGYPPVFQLTPSGVFAADVRGYEQPSLPLVKDRACVYRVVLLLASQHIPVIFYGQEGSRKENGADPLKEPLLQAL